MAKAIYIDFSRCIYCRACEIACEKEHGGQKRLFVFLGEHFAVPLNCRHCEKSPCLTVCYTQALAFREEGIIGLDVSKCTGCKLCISACPFGLISFDSINKVVVKCDLCLKRIAEGKEPACVSTCPARARYYGEYESFVKKLRKRSAFALSGVLSRG